MPTAHANVDPWAQTYEQSARQSLLAEPVPRHVRQQAARQAPLVSPTAGCRLRNRAAGNARVVAGRVEQDQPPPGQEFESMLPSIGRPPDVAGATRAGARLCGLWMRSPDDDQCVVGGGDLVPELLELFTGILEAEA